MKRLLAALLCLLLCCGCGARGGKPDGRLRVVTTVFPLYDFVRAVGGEQVDITLLIDPGTEVHSYDPSPSDAAAVQRADLLVCVGGESEQWFRTLSDEAAAAELVMMDHVALLTEDGEQEYDEHIWTSPANAIRMVWAVRDALIDRDGANAGLYRTNCEEYTARIAAAEQRLAEVLAAADDPFLLVADRFPFKYFAAEFRVEYEAAFDGCASNADLSVRTMARLIDTVRARGLKSAFYVEMSGRQVADALAEETGVRLYELHSAHNVTRDQFRAGITYAELLERNADTLAQALQ